MTSCEEATFFTRKLPGSKNGWRCGWGAVRKPVVWLRCRQCMSDFADACLGLQSVMPSAPLLEFRPPGTFEPLTDMIGGGPFGLLPGQWTDDTSMALCLATSLIEQGSFDPHDQMNRYCRWADSGYLSSNGVCFDIGNTVASALRRYQRDGNPFAGSDDPGSAGNGCIWLGSV